MPKENGEIQIKKTKTEAGSAQASNYIDTSAAEPENKPFVRINKNTIQLAKKDTILFK